MPGAAASMQAPHQPALAVEGNRRKRQAENKQNRARHPHLGPEWPSAAGAQHQLAPHQEAALECDMLTTDRRPPLGPQWRSAAGAPHQVRKNQVDKRCSHAGAHLWILNGGAQQVGGALALLVAGALDQNGARVAVNLQRQSVYQSACLAGWQSAVAGFQVRWGRRV